MPRDRDTTARQFPLAAPVTLGRHSVDHKVTSPLNLASFCARVAVERRTLPQYAPRGEDGEPGDTSADPRDGPERSAASDRRRFTRRRKITAAVIALVVIWAAAVAVDLVVAAEHIHHGEAAVQAARQGLSADGILSGAPVGSLRSAQSEFSSANGLLSSPLLWPMDVLPVAGRQLRSVQDLSGAAEQVAHSGSAQSAGPRRCSGSPITPGPTA